MRMSNSFFVSSSSEKVLSRSESLIGSLSEAISASASRRRLWYSGRNARFLTSIQVCRIMLRTKSMIRSVRGGSSRRRRRNSHKTVMMAAMMMLPMMAGAFVGEAVVDGINYQIITKARTAEVRKLPEGKYQCFTNFFFCIWGLLS